MNTGQLFKILGRISYTYSRTDFYMGYMAMYLNIAPSYIDFFAEQGLTLKLNKLKSAAEKIVSPKLKHAVLQNIQEIKEFSKFRNKLIHGLILQSNDDFAIHHYTKGRGGETIDNTAFQTGKDLVRFDKNFIEVHNRLVKLTELLGEIWKDYNPKGDEYAFETEND